MCTKTIALSDGRVLVTLAGEIDLETAHIVRDALGNAIRLASMGVIVDLGEVTFLDAVGLGVLACAAPQTAHLPAGLRLRAVPPHVAQLLRLTDLDRQLMISRVGAD
jgi:anti-sigma B factor antagonist